MPFGKAMAVSMYAPKQHVGRQALTHCKKGRAACAWLDQMNLQQQKRIRKLVQHSRNLAWKSVQYDTT